MRYILFMCLSLCCINIKAKDFLKTYLNNCTSLEESIKVIDIIKRRNLYSQIPYCLPVKSEYRVSSKYGYRIHPITKKKSFHSGVDFAMNLASLIYATADGKVIFTGRKGGYGKCIMIEHSFGFITLYGHLSAYYVLPGEKIKKGKVIGFVGSTGQSTGNHLHYEIQKNGRHIKPFIYHE